MLADPESDLLQIAPPEVSQADAEAIARQFYGFASTAKQLTGERDLNFLMTGEVGLKRVLKIANAGEAEATLDFQISALRHLAVSDCRDLVPTVIVALSGEALLRVTDRSGRPHFAYMLSFIDGLPMAVSTPVRDAHACKQIGILLGRLDVAMADFRHPAQVRHLLWDLSLVAEMRPKLMTVDDPMVRNLALDAIDRFEDEVLPVLPSLHRQVIHNDLNPHNLILATADPFRVAGIIDFGDMLEGPRANDVAVAASYHFHEGPDAAAALVAGYHATVSMTEQELAIVPLLIAARSVLTIGITSWRAQLYPENRVYIQRNRPAAVRTLTVLHGDGGKRLHDKIETFCQQDMNDND